MCLIHTESSSLFWCLSRVVRLGWHTATNVVEYILLASSTNLCWKSTNSNEHNCIMWPIKQSEMLSLCRSHPHKDHIKVRTLEHAHVTYEPAYYIVRPIWFHQCCIHCYDCSSSVCTMSVHTSSCLCVRAAHGPTAIVRTQRQIDCVRHYPSAIWDCVSCKSEVK